MGTVGAMDRELVGKFKEYLNDIQIATTISVASMLTLDADIHHNRVKVLYSGVDTTTNMWLSFDEDAVIHDICVRKLYSTTLFHHKLFQ